MNLCGAKQQQGSLHLKCNRQAGRAGVLWPSAHRQQAISRDALVRHDAEEPARRHAGVVHQHLEVAAGGKPLPQFPGIDRGNREAQIPGNLLQRDVVLEPPVTERGRKAGADVALEVRLLGHGTRLHEVRLSSEGLNPAAKGPVGQTVRVQAHCPVARPLAGARAMSGEIIKRKAFLFVDDIAGFHTSIQGLFS